MGSRNQLPPAASPSDDRVTTTRVPVTIVSGFLGSGKTTLLNWLLEQQHGLKVAVIVNEFGAVGIDGRLVKGGETFVELDNGCLCCVLSEELDQTLQELKERGGFDALVLETTGVADPLPIAWNFSKPEVADFFRVDAPNVKDAMQHDEARAQLERGDIVIINKLDLTTDNGEAAAALVAKYNDSAIVLKSTKAQVPWEMVLDPEVTNKQRYTTEENTKTGGHAHDSPAFESFHYSFETQVSEEAIEDLFYELPDYVYRLKGIVDTDAPWRWTEVHAVAGRFDMRPLTLDESHQRPPPKPLKSVLVFIGKSLDHHELTRLCKRVENEGRA